jgi:murein DD-endopeptidase MepM/ murein hydrolase activator NlpD
MPFANGRVTSLFNQGRRHPAIDLAGALGSPVYATTNSQRVVFAAWRGGYGKAVITRDAQGRTHLYGHLQSISARVGQMLDQGHVLGRLGSTGRSTGPHVHYEVKTPAGRHINPVTVLFPGRSVSRGYAWRDLRQEIPVRTAAAQPRPR